jgi:hypothetical protein
MIKFLVPTPTRWRAASIAAALYTLAVPRDISAEDRKKLS